MRRDPESQSENIDPATWVAPSEGSAHRPVSSVSVSDSTLSSLRDQTPAPTPPPSLTGPPPGDEGQTLLGSGGPSDSPLIGSHEWEKAPPPLIREGEVVFGHFLLISRLGEGGMGQVWLVRNIKMDRKRALKLIKPEVARNDRGWKRFELEARLMAKFDHRNAVGVYDYDRAHSMGYIEMEFIQGRSVDQILNDRRGQPMPLEWVVEVLEQLCGVLHEAHSHVDEDTGKPKPIIHRDLKPSNLMIVDNKPEGQNLKVLDFGIAKMVDTEGTQEERLTGQGEFVGTVEYCSPEQILSSGGSDSDDAKHRLDGRSDLYSVGVILYQFLTGVRPFRGTMHAVLASHLREKPRPMAEANPDARVPPEVERLVMQCLAKDPAARPRNALELAQRFRAAATRSTTPRAFSWRAMALVASLLIVASALVIKFRDGAGNSSPVKQPVSTIVSKGETTWVATTEKKVEAPPALWEPAGFKAGDLTRPAQGQEPKRLRRLADGVEFNRFEAGVYLPDGYEPEDENRVNGWPQVIVRSEDLPKKKEDRARFLRIAGRRYERGDVREGGPALDGEKNPCTKHWVEVRPFYIQETELTNGAVEDYLKEFEEDRRIALRSWEEAFKIVKDARPKTAATYPAVGVNYPMARKIARHFRGRLPTEAEWELVAKSGTSDFRWAWGNTDPPRRTPWARLYNDTRAGDGPDPCRKNAKDRTEQGVYDMTGNVREWCLEPYRPYSEIIPRDNSRDHPLQDDAWHDWVSREAIDPTQGFVTRGGSWQTELVYSMVYLRSRYIGSEENSDLGFRIVIDCPPSPDTREVGR